MEYPARRWVVPLSLTVMVGFGVILYGFSVYTTDEAAGSEFSTTVLSLAYSGAVFVGGLLAFPVGRFADGHGVRRIVATGALLGCLGLVGFSYATEPWHVVAVWGALIGPAQAMIYYEPAYVAIDQWSRPEDRSRTLATITLIGGLAGIVFIPVAAQLVSVHGWRMSVRLLGLLLLAVGGPTAWLALPPRGRGGQVQGHAVDPGMSFVGHRHFRLYTAALMLILLSTQGVIAHRVARFEEAGFSLTTVASWAAVASAMSLPGRWIAPRLADRFGPTRVQAIITLVVASSLLFMLDGTTSWEMIGHFSLFGLAFGALLPLRAMVMGAWYSGPAYGRIMGAQWTAVVLVGSFGALLVGAARDLTGGYESPVVALTVLFVASAAAIWRSGATAGTDG